MAAQTMCCREIQMDVVVELKSLIMTMAPQFSTPLCHYKGHSFFGFLQKTHVKEITY